MNYLRIFLGALAIVFLSACAHPDLIKMNDTYDHTVSELGKPDSGGDARGRVKTRCVFDAADGTEVLPDDF